MIRGRSKISRTPASPTRGEVQVQHHEIGQGGEMCDSRVGDLRAPTRDSHCKLVKSSRGLSPSSVIGAPWRFSCFNCVSARIGSSVVIFVLISPSDSICRIPERCDRPLSVICSPRLNVQLLESREAGEMGEVVVGEGLIRECKDLESSQLLEPR